MQRGETKGDEKSERMNRENGVRFSKGPCTYIRKVRGVVGHIKGEGRPGQRHGEHKGNKKGLEAKSRWKGLHRPGPSTRMSPSAPGPR